MKAVLINGSPRKAQWNTISLLKATERGLKDAGFETEIFNLYDQLYKGCISCFLCKRKKDIPLHVCQYKDDLTPILDSANSADVIVIGSPVYFSEVTGETRSFLERFLFPITSYMVDKNGNRVKLLDKVIPSAFIFTMNAGEEIAKQMGYPEILSSNYNAMGYNLGSCETLYSYNTYQFKDYSQYEANMFDAVKKAEHHEKQFPEDKKAAYELGKLLANQALKANQN